MDVCVNARSAEDVAGVAVALDFRGVGVKECQAGAASPTSKYLVARQYLWCRSLGSGRLTPLEVVSVPTSNDWPAVKVGSPKTVMAVTREVLNIW